jgi:hypothetical protein
MKKISFLLVVLIKCVLITSAQEAKQEQPAKKGCSCSFSSVNQVGVLHGSKGGYFQIQTINGIRYKTWFAGLGAGIDYYHHLSIPFFVDVRKYIFNKPKTPFLYADAGISLPDKKVKLISSFHQNVYNNGFYGDAGIGYALGFNTKTRWLISTGYSYKNVTYKQKNTWCTGLCNETYFTFKHYLHRLTVKLGLQF